MSDDITELGLNLLIQQITASFTWDILRLSPSFNSMIHFCSKDRAAYKTSDGVLGYDLSIAILFLVTQRVQVKAAKRNIVSRNGKAPCPVTNLPKSLLKNEEFMLSQTHPSGLPKSF
jgi:hypothetical protein